VPVAVRTEAGQNRTPQGSTRHGVPRCCRRDRARRTYKKAALTKRLRGSYIIDEHIRAMGIVNDIPPVNHERAKKQRKQLFLALGLVFLLRFDPSFPKLLTGVPKLASCFLCIPFSRLRGSVGFSSSLMSSDTVAALIVIATTGNQADSEK
jgi:hypothetical protein